MMDGKARTQEIERAKAARSEAEDAWCAVEELLWEIGRGPRSWRRLAVTVGEDKPPSPLTLSH
jgi:hypothetical protein